MPLYRTLYQVEVLSRTHNRTFVDKCPICRADEELIREQP